MKNNIDEDIKIYEIELNQTQAIEVLTNSLNKIEIKGENLYIHKKALKTILNSLKSAEEYTSEVWRKNEDLIDKLETSNNLINRQYVEIDSLKSELETYKKIAEKLAEEWFYTDKVFMIRLKNIHSAKTLLDWARKEVESENK